MERIDPPLPINPKINPIQNDAIYPNTSKVKQLAVKANWKQTNAPSLFNLHFFLLGHQPPA
jgi:hypothetical protein